MIHSLYRADQGGPEVTDATRTERGFHAAGKYKMRRSVAIPMGGDGLAVKPSAQLPP
jgi:hypothetical protein